ncbi:MULTISPECIES: sugar MFS transporter [Pseudoxanthomonas]|jgi:glucose/galactose transporter|uniref:Sugar MFS transporter n=1 Tax=Pseudoxanthomonas winnipegensis TaxID=2480810 RepID=A0A4Q9TH93_9GAMM|nr:sugar MFS transporter [Pseudoxanthomonas winnipegensis]TAA06783.1 sugar MFS transporter [Pseudoxanthomonas winnipegensis]TAA16373.1 sugar MFS transporter [Pseudoxanthomonas winnipegensis]TAA38846.1 sugar MFS transporter [Pseudoxanthomonas winnipegensis]TAH69802.1 sugar MFS transporter [Pseudoxanthomonas winnipegensis]TBV75366.1 sugar MFS transporter [Pseudoxanthomonas winnipegensis]
MSSDQSKRFATSLAITGLLFFIMGFFTWINGPLILFAKVAFEVSDTFAFLIPSAFYISYFCLALPSSVILKLTGMKKGLALSLLVMAIGAAIFGQFTTARSYAGAVSGIFIIGGGLALLQTAINPYISILGPIEGAARRIAVMGICNKVAGALATYGLARLVLHGMEDISNQVQNASPAQKEILLQEFASRIHGPYMVIAVILAIVAVGILFSPLPDISAEDANSSPVTSSTERQSIFSFPHVWLGALCIFVYVGAEVMAGDAIGIYGMSLHLSLDSAKYFTIGTLVCMLVGYLLGFILIPKYVSQEKYLSFSAVLGIVLSICAMVTDGYTSVAFVAALGFANAIMWPAIFPLAIKGLGRFTEKGSALLVMGIVGGAAVPQLFAHFKGVFDFQVVFAVLMIACYLYILFFAMRGHRVGQDPAR